MQMNRYNVSSDNGSRVETKNRNLSGTSSDTKADEQKEVTDENNIKPQATDS
jgi:hypothetical protein